MVRILNEFIEGDFIITQYTKDGKNVSHIVKKPIIQETGLVESQPSISELILAENLYQTALLEIQMIGGE